MSGNCSTPIKDVTGSSFKVQTGQMGSFNAKTFQEPDLMDMCTSLRGVATVVEGCKLSGVLDGLYEYGSF